MGEGAGQDAKHLQPRVCWGTRPAGGVQDGRGRAQARSPPDETGSGETAHRTGCGTSGRGMTGVAVQVPQDRCYQLRGPVAAADSFTTLVICVGPHFGKTQQRMKRLNSPPRAHPLCGRPSPPTAEEIPGADRFVSRHFRVCFWQRETPFRGATTPAPRLEEAVPPIIQHHKLTFEANLFKSGCKPLRAFSPLTSRTRHGCRRV